MTRRGNPYDNALTESFIKTLKYEEIYLWEYRTLEDVQQRLPYFIFKSSGERISQNFSKAERRGDPETSSPWIWDYRFEYWGLLLAPLLPYFFRSFTLESRVKKPAFFRASLKS